jgi:transposase
MARYKHQDYNQTKMIPLCFADQIQPDSFEYTLNHVIDNDLDLNVFAKRYRNDTNGAPAYDPAILLKVVLFAYSRGITTSRNIAKVCRENVIFMALSADSRPHHSTVADFVTCMDEGIKPLFTHVLMVCNQMGLIGREMFAIDGCKLPSNASKEWNGTHAELTRKQQKINRAVARMLASHRSDDQRSEPEIQVRQEAQIKKLQHARDKIQEYLETEPERLGRGKRPRPVKGNITDPESAKMKTSKGTIQGYNGIAAVDSKHQIIVHAQAYGEGPEQHALVPMLLGVKRQLQQVSGKDQRTLQTSRITADSGFHSEGNMKSLFKLGVDGYIADNQFRKRDPRFIDSTTYKEEQAKRQKERGYTSSKRFVLTDFDYDPIAVSCRCPAGNLVWCNMNNGQINGRRATSFQGYRKDYRVCPLKAQCLRKPDQKDGRQVTYFDKSERKECSYMNRMKEKIDSPMGRRIYSQRLGTVEPVFGNIEANKGLKRFTLRGKVKVNAQWMMFCMVHNIEKIATQGQQ